MAKKPAAGRPELSALREWFELFERDPAVLQEVLEEWKILAIRFLYPGDLDSSSLRRLNGLADLLVAWCDHHPTARIDSARLLDFHAKVDHYVDAPRNDDIYWELQASSSLAFTVIRRIHIAESLRNHEDFDDPSYVHADTIIQMYDEIDGIKELHKLLDGVTAVDTLHPSKQRWLIHFGQFNQYMRRFRRQLPKKMSRQAVDPSSEEIKERAQKIRAERGRK